MAEHPAPESAPRVAGYVRVSSAVKWYNSLQESQKECRTVLQHLRRGHTCKEVQRERFYHFHQSL